MLHDIANATLRQDTRTRSSTLKLLKYIVCVLYISGPTILGELKGSPPTFLLVNMFKILVVATCDYQS